MTNTITPPPLNPPPRAKFQASADWVSGHHKLMDSQEMERALHFSLLEYNRRLTEQTVDMAGAAANHWKMVGASEFVHQLRYLAEPTRATAPAARGNLNHDA